MHSHEWELARRLPPPKRRDKKVRLRRLEQPIAARDKKGIAGRYDASAHPLRHDGTIRSAPHA